MCHIQTLRSQRHDCRNSVLASHTGKRDWLCGILVLVFPGTVLVPLRKRQVRRLCLPVWYASLVLADIEVVDDLSVFFSLLMNTNGTKAAQCSAEHLQLKGASGMNRHVSLFWMLLQNVLQCDVCRSFLSGLVIQEARPKTRSQWVLLQFSIWNLAIAMCFVLCRWLNTLMPFNECSNCFVYRNPQASVTYVHCFHMEMTCFCWTRTLMMRVKFRFAYWM